MSLDVTAFDSISTDDLDKLSGCGTFSFRDTEHLESQIDYIDLTKYSDFAIKRCSEILDAVLAEMHPKCGFCVHRQSCHGFSDCEWSRKAEVVQLRNLCRALSTQNEARGGCHNDSE